MAEWFAPKRYGYGVRPVTWQGWLITVSFCAIVIIATRLIDRSRVAAASIIVTSTVIFLLIVINNTRGGWRWRWGKGTDHDLDLARHRGNRR